MTRTANAGARVVGNLSVENSAVAKRSRATTVELTKTLCCVQVIMGRGILGFYSYNLGAFVWHTLSPNCQLSHLAAPILLWINVI